MYHENKPSRQVLHHSMELLRYYCMGDRPCAIEFRSDPSSNFRHSKSVYLYYVTILHVHMPTYLPISMLYLCACLYVRLRICMPVWMPCLNISMRLSVCLFGYLYACGCVSLCLSGCLSAYQYASLCAHLRICARLDACLHSYFVFPDLDY